MPRATKGRSRAVPADPYPGFIEPAFPTGVEMAPRKGDWVHEIKNDGYRVQLHVDHGRVTIFTRRGYDWTDRFVPIAAAAKALNVETAIIDGEAVGLGSNGNLDYQVLLNEIGKRASKRLRFIAFDLLYCDGHDIRKLPLLERKTRLEKIIPPDEGAITFGQHLTGDTKKVIENACRLGLEGIVSKRADSRYQSGRTDAWVKFKCTKSESYPIVAFVEKLGAKPRRIASLYVGRWDGDRLLYAGKIRSGYNERAARDIRERLDPLIVKKSPLSEPANKPKATWVNPELLAEVNYSSLTESGIVREGVFKGVRDDLMDAPLQPVALKKVSKAKPRRGASETKSGVPYENILQLLPHAVAPTKDALRTYWKKVHREALRYLARRPLKLVRHYRDTTFYHKGPLPPIPDAVHQLRIQKREGGEGIRVWVEDLDGLLGLVDMDVVEVHPWNGTADEVECADVMVFDLDPGPEIEWKFVVETALALKDELEGLGYEPWPKLTGGKGIHLMVPLEERLTHDSAHRLSKAIAQEFISRAPKKYTLSASPERREGRIFIDYLRNGRGTNAVGTFSPRARMGFPIAAPVQWSDLEAGMQPNARTIKSPLRSERKSKIVLARR